MNKIKKGLKIGFLTFGMMMIFGCGTVDEEVVVSDKQGEELVENEKSCNVDSDCVPASCCHSTDVVNKENAPSCENLKCTASCETVLDCGQGRPVCNEGQCEIEVNGESDLRSEKSGDLEEIKEINESEAVFIEKAEDCEKLFDKESLSAVEYSFQNLNLIEKRFGYKQKENYLIGYGWCLYKKVNDNYLVVGFGDNPKGVSPMTFIQNKYLIYSESCGSPCVSFNALNVIDQSKKVIGGSVYHELSGDNKWLIEYDHSLWGRNKTNEYLAKAINLDTFETIDFAKNNCLNENCDFVFDYEYANKLDKINFIDNKKGIVKIQFIENKTREKIYRTFDMKNNFKEI